MLKIISFKNPDETECSFLQCSRNIFVESKFSENGIIALIVFLNFLCIGVERNFFFFFLNRHWISLNAQHNYIQFMYI